MTDRYKRLMTNTLIFAIGTFGSKLLVYLLVPLYTYVLSEGEYGIADLIQQTSNLLHPLVSLGITNAVIRFGLDKNVRKSDVFTSGLLCVMCGGGVLTLLSPLLLLIEALSSYAILLAVFAVVSTMRSLCAQFVRAQGRVRLYAIDGILSTATLLSFTILFLTVFRWGVFGYIFAIVCSDLLSVIFLTVTGKLWRFVSFRTLQCGICKDMLRFSLPLIPNTLLWWVTNVSDRYFILYMMGEAYNGPYAVAYKIPALIVLVSGVFMNAWQISAVTEQKEREHFYSRVANAYVSVLLIGASLILLFDRFLIGLWVSDAYFVAWQYVPLLTIAAVFTCLVDFLGSIYMVEKKSLHSLATAAVSAVVNVILNALLIPIWGVNGAAFATAVCYFVVFLIRMWDTRRYIRIRWAHSTMWLSVVLIVTQTVLLLWQVPYNMLWQGLLCVVLLALNMRGLIGTAQQLLHRRGKDVQ